MDQATRQELKEIIREHIRAADIKPRLHVVADTGPHLDEWGHHAGWCAWVEPEPGHAEKIRKWAAGESWT